MALTITLPFGTTRAQTAPPVPVPDTAADAALKLRIDSTAAFIELARTAATAAREAAIVQRHQNVTAANTALDNGITRVREQQKAIVFTVNGIVQRYATAAWFATVVTRGVSSAITVTSLASPFASKTFADDYNRLVAWKGVAPLLGLTAAALYNPKGKPSADVQRTRGLFIGGGASLYGLLDLIGGRRSKNGALDRGAAKIEDATLLLNANQASYDDLERVAVLAASVNAMDTALSTQFDAFRTRTNYLAGLGRDSLANDPAHVWYVDSSLVYVARLQKKLAAVSAVWEALGVAVTLADTRLRQVDTAGAQTPYIKDLKARVAKARQAQQELEDDWQKTLAANIDLSPATLAQLNLYDQLEVLVGTLASQRQ